VDWGPLQDTKERRLSYKEDQLVLRLRIDLINLSSRLEDSIIEFFEFNKLKKEDIQINISKIREMFVYLFASELDAEIQKAHHFSW
jgi:hypothetical protein